MAVKKIPDPNFEHTQFFSSLNTSYRLPKVWKQHHQKLVTGPKRFNLTICMVRSMTHHMDLLLTIVIVYTFYIYLSSHVYTFIIWSGWKTHPVRHLRNPYEASKILSSSSGFFERKIGFSRIIAQIELKMGPFKKSRRRNLVFTNSRILCSSRIKHVLKQKKGQSRNYADYFLPIR